MSSAPVPPKPEPMGDDIDATLDADPDVDMAQAPAAASSSMEGPEAGGPSSSAPNASGEVRQEALDVSLQEARVPLRKDISLREFLSRMDDYAPVIPDAVTFHALTLAGLPPPPLSAVHPPSSGTAAPGADAAATNNNNHAASPSDPNTPLPLARLLALATQKFVADIAADAYQYSRMRSGTLTSNTLSALSNPGAPGPGTGGAGATGAAAGGGGGGGGAGGAGGGAGGKQAGQHVLGVQRPGFGGGGQGGGQGRTVLTMEDLGMAVGEYGVNVKRGEFYR